MARVTAIHIAAASGSLLSHVPRVAAHAGHGLVGDRNYGAGDGRQITIVSEAELGDAALELGHSIEAGATRRNVTVSDVRLPRDLGARIRLGDVVVEVVRDCSPCELMEETVGPGARRALIGRAGVRANIVEGGTLAVGDEVTLVPSQ